MILIFQAAASVLTDEEVLMLVKSKYIPAYKLESWLDNYQRGVNIRRQLISERLPDSSALKHLPYSNYDYKYVSVLAFY